MHDIHRLDEIRLVFLTYLVPYKINKKKVQSTTVLLKM